jgi:hypothetical protein
MVGQADVRLLLTHKKTPTQATMLREGFEPGAQCLSGEGLFMPRLRSHYDWLHNTKPKLIKGSWQLQ